MRAALKLFVAEAVVTAIAVALIADAYDVLLPEYFNGQKTYSVLVVGLVLIAVASGYIAHHMWPTRHKPGWFVLSGISTGITILTFLLCLFFIVRSRGS